MHHPRPPAGRDPDREVDASYDDEDTLVVEPHHFAIVPEWIIDADISDAAYRLYSVLLRYGQSSGRRMPSRGLLACRLRRSVDSIDRAMKELVALGAVVVEARHRDRAQLSNRYHLRTSPPAAGGADEAVTPSPHAPSPVAAPAGSQTRRSGGGRKSAARGSRTRAARGAADLRPDPVVPTQEHTPPPTPSAKPSPGVDLDALCIAAGLSSLDALAEQCRDRRRALGRPATPWTTKGVTAALGRALDAGWPVAAVVPALLAIATDPDTVSPARLSCPGPWWSASAPAGAAPLTADERSELHGLEEVLAEADGRRVAVQRLAREQLTAEGLPLTRLTVARRACGLLRPVQSDAPALTGLDLNTSRNVANHPDAGP